MFRQVEFYKKFSKRMLILALIIGVLIAISMPITYFVLSLEGEKNQATLHANRIEQEIEESIKLNPTLWEYNIQKLMSIFSQAEISEISDIKLYNNSGILVYEERFSDPTFYPIKAKVEIIFNNKSFGYILLREKSNVLMKDTIFLVIGFTLLGVVIATILYKFPVKIVYNAEKEIKKFIEKLNYLSYYDSLTQLSNKAYFYEYIEMLIKKQPTRKEPNFAVLILDIDRFKQVNDSLGHSTGDKLLVEVSKRINELVDNKIIVSRFGGDEFSLLIPSFSDSKEIEELANEVVKSFTNPFIVHNMEIYLTGSIGISAFPKDGCDTEALIKNADTALYQAKKQGKNTYVMYLKNMNERSIELLEFESFMRRAVENEQFTLTYQPKIDLKTGNIVGMEALVRLYHHELGEISPKDFIPLAEETGLIIKIGEWVLRNACRDNKAWQDRGLPKIPVSVNLSMKQFKQKNLISMIRKILSETGLEPKYLELEITESVTIDDKKETIRKLQMIKEMGVILSVDDFGTGYSSLGYLKELPIDNVKIDKSFLDSVPDDFYDSTLLVSIINMAHSLNLKVIAEGIETADKLMFLRKNNCDQYQGYIYSPPISSLEFEKLLLANEKRELIIN